MTDQTTTRHAHVHWHRIGHAPRTVEVKNLGWLLRHASESYVLEACRDRYRPGEDGPLAPNLLRVIGTHPVTGAVWTYWTNFSSWSVLEDWIGRRAFAHLGCREDDAAYHRWVKSDR